MKMHLALKTFVQRHSRSMMSFGLLALILAGSLSANAQIAKSAQKQIDEIVAIKHSLTPDEKKLSSNLVLMERDAAGTLPKDLKSLINTQFVDANGDAILEVNGRITANLLKHPAMAGVDKVDGQVSPLAFTTGRVRAHVKVKKLLDLAAHTDVKSLREPAQAVHNAGSLTSQGYVSHGANKVAALGVTGAGVKVGVISDSASAARVAALIASGDLPANTVVLPGQDGQAQGGEDEGAAMMEIIHDLAPGAQLFFATADISEDGFAANIVALRETYGCDIIVDDVGYYDEPVFQDGIVAQAVNTVTAEGALYFSAAANSGNLDSGTSGTWEGDFLDGGANGPAAIGGAGAGDLHNFGTVASPVLYDTLTTTTSVISLKWSDPLGASDNDYDIYLLNAAGTGVLGYSADVEDGTQDPIEIFGTNSTYPAGSKIYVALYFGVPRALHLDTNRARLAIATAGETHGHNGADKTFSTAAVYWNSAHTGAKIFTGGAANPVETFSSDGPRKMFYNPDGTAITPGNVLFGTNGGFTLQKPDGAAADGITDVTPLFNPFYGTSAAAPHAAAIAALVKSANPALTNTQIRNILTSTALDNMALGIDRDTGYGIVMALPAVNAAKALLPH